MSTDRKTAPDAQKPASPSPASPSPDRRLVKLLRQREGAQSEDKYDDADDRLVELIEDCLLSGDNKALFDAVERAGRQGGRDLALALAESIEDCTASRIIQFEKKTRRGVRTEVADLSLHVLPIVTVSDHGLSAAKRLLPKDGKSNEMIRALEHSFKAHGLAPESAHIRVAPYLYHWDELNTLAYSEIHELGLTMMNEKDDDVACARKGWPPLPHIHDGKYIELRFLVVTTVTPMTEPHVPFIARFDQAPEEEAFESFDRQRHAWANAVAPLLAEWIGGEAINLTAPFSFFDGLRAGWIFHADSSLALGVEFAIKSQFLFPRECSVHLALHGDDNEAHLRVTLTHQQKLIHGLMRPIAAFEDREAVLQNTVECLKPLHLGALSVQGGVQPAFHCEGCKAPLFSTPWGDLLHPGEPEDFDDEDEGEDSDEDDEDGYGDDEGAFEKEDLEGHDVREFSGAVNKQKDPVMLKVAAVLQGKTLH